MKKLFSFIAIIGIITASNCSRIPENDDPVIGIWSSAALSTSSETAKVSTQYEWIFNDAYLGRYHVKENGSLTVISDFSWSEEDGVYTITYPGLDDKPDDEVTMEAGTDQASLIDVNGNVLAIRE